MSSQPNQFEVHPVEITTVSDKFFGSTAKQGNTTLRAIDNEYADDERGLKVVFQGIRFDGAVATFETGSFLDGQGEDGEVIKHDVCVSTAGGCTRRCTMCSVPIADIGFERLLTADEIVTQVTYATSLRNPSHNLPNVVGFMGNGEPPDNAALAPAIRMLDSMRGNDGRKLVDRMTISTIGENVRSIDELAIVCAGLETSIKLQFSLHAVDELKRRIIVPGKASLDKIMRSIDGWAELTGEAVKYNVVLMEGTGQFTGLSNATPEDAKKLAGLLLSPSKISGNLIERRLKLSAFNPIPGIDYQLPNEETRAAFVETLRTEGIETIKTFKGSGIEINPEEGKGGFACGQLRRTTGLRLISSDGKLLS